MNARDRIFAQVCGRPRSGAAPLTGTGRVVCRRPRRNESAADLPIALSP